MPIERETIIERPALSDTSVAVISSFGIIGGIVAAVVALIIWAINGALPAAMARSTSTCRKSSLPNRRIAKRCDVARQSLEQLSCWQPAWCFSRPSWRIFGVAKPEGDQ